jgi:hypothetical protein
MLLECLEQKVMNLLTHLWGILEVTTVTLKLKTHFTLEVLLENSGSFLQLVNFAKELNIRIERMT